MPDAQLREAMTTIRRAARQMATDDRFKLVFEEYRPLEADDIDYWAERVGTELKRRDYVIPSPLRQIYGSTGGFRFQWQYLPGPNGPVSGSSQLATLMEIYQRDEESDVPLADLYQHKRPFDTIGGDELTWREVPPDRGDEVSLVHVDEEGKAAHLSLDPVEYIVRMAEFRAIYGWQALFVSDQPPDRTATDRLTRQVDLIFGSGVSE
jgi:hypothetical protein